MYIFNCLTQTNYMPSLTKSKYLSLAFSRPPAWLLHPQCSCTDIITVTPLNMSKSLHELYSTILLDYTICTICNWSCSCIFMLHLMWMSLGVKFNSEIYFCTCYFLCISYTSFAMSYKIFTCCVKVFISSFLKSDLM